MKKFKLEKLSGCNITQNRVSNRANIDHVILNPKGISQRIFRVLGILLPRLPRCFGLVAPFRLRLPAVFVAGMLGKLIMTL